MTVSVKPTRTVWVGYLQLDEYGESISVHDKVEWQVSAFRAGFPGGALPEDPPLDFELDRYAAVMGLAQAALRGTVARIRRLDSPASANLATESSPAGQYLYSTREQIGRAPGNRAGYEVQGEAEPLGLGGFVVDVILDDNSDELEALRERLPGSGGKPQPHRL